MTISADTPGAGLWRDPARLLALGFGAGCAPFAPGTFGTLFAAALYWFARWLPAPDYALLTLALFGVGVWACGRTARALETHDHPAIVWDEVAAYFLTMTAAPVGLGWMALGFVAFRIFDILKPWPVRAADEHLPGGFGIMADDALAGAYAWLVVQGTAWFMGV